ncbi:MAG: sigma-54-dependent Fis family transcriptional regulator [Acidobacteria bacterium]|nr:sigma-54-dependent Fis family transcriptional regulator [Acidobacteriota bacterium]
MLTREILVVDDDSSVRRVLEYHLEEAGHGVLVAPDGGTGFDLFTGNRIDLVITDIMMPEIDGLELLRRIKAMSPETAVIVITAHGSIENAVAAMKLGAYDYITKPFNREELLLTVDKALQISAVLQENRYLKQFIQDHFTLEGILGTSRKMRRLFERVKKVAGTDAPVLLLGESGTGKELFAKAIHQHSSRRDYPFMAINCAAIPEGLLESELFGHKKGAFTGAHADQKGRIEIADHGTVFLDEITELPLPLQPKLLRLLQDGEYNRVGETSAHHGDIRTIAATNRDIEKLVEDRVFREDLYYRINVVPIVLPPLRERREDIPLLANHFLQELAQRYNRPDLRLDKEVFRYFHQYPWPGNVRELKNAIEQMMIFSPGDVLDATGVPDHIKRPHPHAGNVLIQLPDEGIDMEEVERDILLQALKRNDWCQTTTAKYLNITRSALIYRMQKFQLREGQDKPNTTDGG